MTMKNLSTDHIKRSTKTLRFKLLLIGIGFFPNTKIFNKPLKPTRRVLLASIINVTSLTVKP